MKIDCVAKIFNLLAVRIFRRNEDGKSDELGTGAKQWKLSDLSVRKKSRKVDLVISLAENASRFFFFFFFVSLLDSFCRHFLGDDAGFSEHELNNTQMRTRRSLWLGGSRLFTYHKPLLKGFYFNSIYPNEFAFPPRTQYANSTHYTNPYIHPFLCIRSAAPSLFIPFHECVMENGEESASTNTLYVECKETRAEAKRIGNRIEENCDKFNVKGRANILFYNKIDLDALQSQSSRNFESEICVCYFSSAF